MNDTMVPVDPFQGSMITGQQYMSNSQRGHDDLDQFFLQDSGMLNSDFSNYAMAHQQQPMGKMPNAFTPSQTMYSVDDVETYPNPLHLDMSLQDLYPVPDPGLSWDSSSPESGQRSSSSEDNFGFIEPAMIDQSQSSSTLFNNGLSPDNVDRSSEDLFNLPDYLVRSADFKSTKPSRTTTNDRRHKSPDDDVKTSSTRASTKKRAAKDEAPSDAKPRKRTRTSKPLSEAQKKTKHEKFLANNREAASKCRQKKKLSEAALVEYAHELTATVDSLRHEVASLKASKMELEQEIARHSHCGDPNIDMFFQSGMKLPSREAEVLPTKMGKMNQRAQTPPVSRSKLMDDLHNMERSKSLPHSWVR